MEKHNKNLNELTRGIDAPETLSPINAAVRAKKLGLLKGKIEVPDDFNAPLPDDEIAAFEGR